MIEIFDVLCGSFSSHGFSGPLKQDCCDGLLRKLLYRSFDHEFRGCIVRRESTTDHVHENTIRLLSANGDPVLGNFEVVTTQATNFAFQTDFKR